MFGGGLHEKADISFYSHSSLSFLCSLITYSLVSGFEESGESGSSTTSNYSGFFMKLYTFFFGGKGALRTILSREGSLSLNEVYS